MNGAIMAGKLAQVQPSYSGGQAVRYPWRAASRRIAALNDWGTSGPPVSLTPPPS